MFGGLVIGSMGNLFGGKSDSSDSTNDTAHETTGGDDDPPSWVAVFETVIDLEANIISSRLNDEDIPTRIRREAANSAIPVDVGILGRIEVMVPEPLLDKAMTVLEAELVDDEEIEWWETDDDEDMEVL